MKVAFIIFVICIIYVSGFRDGHKRGVRAGIDATIEEVKHQVDARASTPN